MPPTRKARSSSAAGPATNGAQVIAELRALVTQEVLELRARLLDLDRRQRESDEHVQRLLEDARRAEKRRKRARAEARRKGSSPADATKRTAPGKRASKPARSKVSPSADTSAGAAPDRKALKRAAARTDPPIDD